MTPDQRLMGPSFLFAFSGPGPTMTLSLYVPATRIAASLSAFGQKHLVGTEQQ